MAVTSLFSLWGLKVNRTFADLFACSFTAPQNTACALYLNEKWKEQTHKGILQDNSAEEATATQWSPDIIHNIDRRPLSTEGRAHLKVTDLGDRGTVCTALPPRQQSPWSLTYKDRFLQCQCPLGWGVTRHLQYPGSLLLEAVRGENHITLPSLLPRKIDTQKVKHKDTPQYAHTHAQKPTNSLTTGVSHLQTNTHM